MSVCRHCGRDIVSAEGIWVDPLATGDDSVWRETCDAHDTFVADHEPTTTQHRGTMTLPTNERLALAVRLDELDTDDSHVLDQYITNDRLGSEAYSVVDELIDIASAALSECQRLEGLLNADAFALDLMSGWLAEPTDDGQWRSACDFIEYAANLISGTGRPVDGGQEIDMSDLTPEELANLNALAAKEDLRPDQYYLQWIDNQAVTKTDASVTFNLTDNRPNVDPDEVSARIAEAFTHTDLVRETFTTNPQLPEETP